MRAAYASTGAVIALPHSGNWDLAGAYAELTGMPVTTVAEAAAPAPSSPHSSPSGSGWACRCCPTATPP